MLRNSTQQVCRDGLKRLTPILLGLGLALLCSPVAQAAEDPGPRAVVVLRDYANIQRGVLERAQREAVEILETAGIRLEWLNLTISDERPPQRVEDPPSRKPACNLNIISDSMLKKIRRAEGEFGFTAATTVYVFAGPAESLSVSFGTDLSILLGLIMAHEIGHVLIGPNGHAPDSIMTPNLGKRELHQAARGRLVFSEAQAKRMRERLAVAQTASDSAVPLAQYQQ